MDIVLIAAVLYLLWPWLVFSVLSAILIAWKIT